MTRQSTAPSWRRLFAIAGALALLTACGEQAAPPTPAGPGPGAAPDVLATGERLFRQHCARCHGENAEGAPDWRKQRPDGSFPAPPLNCTGHAWHHSMDVLRMTIREGTARLGGTMPAWGGTLSEAEIDAIIHWFQAKWSPEIYRQWQEIDRR